MSERNRLSPPQPKSAGGIVTGPVDVQAKGLRELADRALGEALALLAGQAEQIERLIRRAETAEAAWEAEFGKRTLAVRQRDNLRDALRQAREDVGDVYLDGFDSSRRKKALAAVERIDVALRAAAVGEGAE